MKKIAIFLFAALLAACGQMGSEFEGHWTGSDQGRTLMTIEQKGGNFLVSLTDTLVPDEDTTPVPAKLVDGKLFMSNSGTTISYVESKKSVVVNTMLGDVEFTRAK